MRTTTGWRREHWLVKPFAPIVHPDDLPHTYANFALPLNGSRPNIYTVRCLTKWEHYIRLELAITLRVIEGQPIGFLGLAHQMDESRAGP